VPQVDFTDLPDHEAYTDMQRRLAQQYGWKETGAGEPYDFYGKRVRGGGEGYRSRYYRDQSGAEVRVSNHGAVNNGARVGDVAIEIGDDGGASVKAQRFGSFGGSGGGVFNRFLDPSDFASAAEYNQAVHDAIAEALSAHGATRPK